jgi:hypothetical protein
MAGRIDFMANDTSTTTNQYVAQIEAQAISTISTDINPGRVVYRATSSTVAATPSEYMRATSLGLNIMGAADPSAYLHLGAGTATASTAPLKFTSGTNNTTAETGAMEYNGTNLFFTRTGTTREGVLTQSAVTTEVQVSDTTVTVNIGGVTYKLLAKA